MCPPILRSCTLMCPPPTCMFRRQPCNHLLGGQWPHSLSSATRSQAALIVVLQKYRDGVVQVVYEWGLTGLTSISQQKHVPEPRGAAVTLSWMDLRTPQALSRKANMDIEILIYGTEYVLLQHPQPPISYIVHSTSKNIYCSVVGGQVY